MKTYSELITLDSIEERFKYLLIGGGVGQETFGYRRYLNQEFYHSKRWREFRRDIILRDQGCEMGLWPYEIQGLIMIHHIEPVDISDIIYDTDILLNPENVICVSGRMHNAIHYGDFSVLEPLFYERLPGDTKLW